MTSVLPDTCPKDSFCTRNCKHFTLEGFNLIRSVSDIPENHPHKTSLQKCATKFKNSITNHQLAYNKYKTDVIKFENTYGTIFIWHERMSENIPVPEDIHRKLERLRVRSTEILQLQHVELHAKLEDLSKKVELAIMLKVEVKSDKQKDKAAALKTQPPSVSEQSSPLPTQLCRLDSLDDSLNERDFSDRFRICDAECTEIFQPFDAYQKEVLALPEGSHKSTCLKWCLEFDRQIKKHFGAAVAEEALETGDGIKTAYTYGATDKLDVEHEMDNPADHDSEATELRKAFEVMQTADNEHEKLRKAFDERPSIDG